MNLVFYPPREYVHHKGYNYHYDEDFPLSYEEFMQRLRLFHHLPTLEKELFSNEELFPPVFQVEAIISSDLTPYKSSIQELNYEIAYLVGKWWKGLFIQYQRLYHSHGICTMEEFPESVNDES